MAELTHQIPINATPEKVYAALSTQAGLRGWWTVDATADEKVGGKADFGFDKRQMVFRMCNSSWGELMIVSGTTRKARNRVHIGRNNWFVGGLSALTGSVRCRSHNIEPGVELTMAVPTTELVILATAKAIQPCRGGAAESFW